MAKVKLKYKRILLKLSGEVLGGDSQSSFDVNVCRDIVKQVIEVSKLGVQVAIVVGGGNIWRFRDNKNLALDRVDSDHMGMMATVMNIIFLKNVFSSLKHQKVHAFSALSTPSVAMPYTVCRARKSLTDGNVVLLGGGTGSPYFTTDSASALRALELKCDAMLKATNVDFVYDKDPSKHKNAKKFTSLTYGEVLAGQLGVMDLAAISLASSNSLPIEVFNLQKKGNIMKVVSGQKVGTLIKS